MISPGDQACFLSLSLSRRRRVLHMEGVRGFVKGYGENKVPERERKALRTLGMAGCQLSFGIKGGY